MDTIEQVASLKRQVADLEDARDRMADALRELSRHPAFADDAPEFNEGGIGYNALHGPVQWDPTVLDRVTDGIARDM